MNTPTVKTQGSYLVCGSVRVHVDTEHVDIFLGAEGSGESGWEHQGSIQALRDNPADFHLSPLTIKRLDALWSAL